MENYGATCGGPGCDKRLRQVAEQNWPQRRWKSSWPVRPQFTVKLGQNKKLPKPYRLSFNC